jgi:ATP-dependent 26S proteasome regulatory subunit
MRKKILDIVLRDIEGTFDTTEIAAKADGYSGSDLRLIVREAVLNALITERTALTQLDLLRGVTEFNKRTQLKTLDEKP